LRLSVADIDWTQLSAGERETLEQVVPRLEDGYSIREIAELLGVDADALELDWENLAARVMALSGHVELPPLSDEEFEALKQSIAEHGQKSPILRGSPTSGAPGAIVDGEHRLRVCAQLRIEPWIVDVDGDADQLRSLGLVLNLARRHLSASSRRGIIKAELLRDPTRSDRAIASFVGVSPTTVGTVRRELEQTGRVSKLDSRTSQDGRQRPATASTPRSSEPPRETVVKVAVPIDLAEQWIGVWVDCRAFRLAERRPGIYELEVQLLDAAAIDDDRVVALTAAAAELGQAHGCSVSDAIEELLATAREVFARDIPTLLDLTQQEAEWLVARAPTLAETSAR
jgi:ParB-like chromosome segregation protein Spo0J